MRWIPGYAILLAQTSSLTALPGGKICSALWLACCQHFHVFVVATLSTLHEHLVEFKLFLVFFITLLISEG